MFSRTFLVVLGLGVLATAGSGQPHVPNNGDDWVRFFLNDSPISIAHEDYDVINRIWGIGLRYQLDNAEVVFDYDKDNRVKSSNSNVVANYYQCRDGRILAIVGNLSKDDQTAEMSFSALRQKLFTVRDEYAERDLDALDGNVVLTVKGRQFRIIGL